MAKPPGGVNFGTGTWKDVLDMARTQHRYIFLDCFTTWCGPCRWMSANVFPTDEAGTFFNDHFVNATFDMEKGEGIELAKKYHVDAYPTYLFLDSTGTVVHRIVGSMPLEDFLAAAKKALNPDTQYATLVKEYESGKASVSTDAYYDMAYTFKEANDNRCVAVSDVYLRSQDNLLTPKNIRMVYDFTFATDAPWFAVMRDHPAEFIQAIGKDDYNNRMLYIVYHDAQRMAGLTPATTKEQAPAVIDSARQFFLKMLPDREPELTSTFAMQVYSAVKDYDNYARQTIAHYTQFPTTDANELNNVAWNFFEDVDNPEYLAKALDWALESVKLSPAYENMDTAANLYWKLGKKSEARDYATKAIALGKSAGTDTSSTEALLETIDHAP